MIIRKLTMYNFGVYQGENSFKFNGDKPIVLVGGMNGRGKTTFLEAILLSLYGQNSNAFKESKYKSYNQYLRSYVNNKSFSQSTYLEMEFVMNESNNNTYIVRREWDALSKITRETITVYENGKYSDFLTNNWPMFIENILPSALSSFYFFDGEKIAELAVDNTSEQMKNSIRSMLGITVLDVLKNDLKRILSKNNKKIVSQDNSIDALRTEKEKMLCQLEKIIDKKEKYQIKFEEAEKKLEDYHRKYELKGGDVLEQKKLLMQKRAELQAEIQHNNEELIACAASSLPLYLIKNLIVQIKLQAEDEHNDMVMQEAIENLEILLEEFAVEHRDAYENSKRFMEYVRNNTIENSVDKLFEISDHSLFQINSLLEHELESDLDKTKECLKNKKILNKNLDEIDSYLSLDINEKELSELYKRIKVQEDKIVLIKVKLNEYIQAETELQAHLTTKTNILNKAIEDYLKNVEVNDDRERISKYTNMAIQLADSFEIELQRRKTDLLGKTITDCYKQLANKKNLIDQIVMDPETLNIYYLDENNNEVNKDSLSAGEKQLVVISILWALGICSTKKLPVIIDTPLSRLDSSHRTAVIKTYFPNASEQTIILSTDTEIDHNYYDMIKEYVDDEFTLDYNEETKSTTIKKGYFQK